MAKDVMNYDVVVVGAGPSGLACAIHLKQLALTHKTELSIAILEKGSNVGANVISGCVMDPQGLDELIPNWMDLDFPVKTLVKTDQIRFLTKNSSLKLPTPKKWSNAGNYIISLSGLCRRLAEYAEDLGVEIYPGFAAASVIIENERVVGVVTGDVGISKNGEHGPNYQLGIEIRAKQVVLAEGARGSISKQIMQKFNLENKTCRQTFGLGIKEIWQVNANVHKPGSVSHYIGYPLYNSAYGGGFVYHLQDNLVAVGLVTALDYANPYLSPYEEFQKFKLHPEIRQVLSGGKRLEYGARAINESGLQSLPKLTFPGGVLVGDSAGFVNVPKAKGVHYSIKSGMLAAEAIVLALKEITPSRHHSAGLDPCSKDISDKYQALLHSSWLYKDLYSVRNVRPAFNRGLCFGLFYAALEHYLFKGKLPWTFKHDVPDNQKLQARMKFKPIKYAAPDGIITFDRLSSVYLANISFDENQPCHLKLRDATIPLKVNLAKFAAPETKYCPAGVYEIVNHQDTGNALQINAANCVHCKACDIKDPEQNITWTVPEGGSGPQYSYM